MSINGVARIFVGGGHPLLFPSSPEADSVGGGGSGRKFPGYPLADQIQWGGG